MSQEFFIYLACIPVLGILAQLLAWWTRLPSILLLLVFGILLGFVFNPDQLLHDIYASQNPQGELGGSVRSSIEPGTSGSASTVATRSNVAAAILFPIVSLSVAVILFEGGLTLRMSDLKESGGIVLRLVSLGALFSWALTGLAAWGILGLDWRIATLLGAIMVVTGPTVVIPLLRHIRPNRRIGAIVKWEGIVIDPVGAILAVLVFEHLFSHLERGTDYNSLATIMVLLKSVVIGVGLAWISAALLVKAVKSYWIPDFLHGVSFLAVAIGAFAVSNVLQHESGLVTVTAMGIFLANQKQVSIDHVIEFKEHLGVFLVSCLFIVLGSRLRPEVMLDIGWQGLVFLIIMIVIVRPISIWLATIGSKINFRERLFISCLAPRGIVSAAVTSVFALKLVSLSSTNPAFAEFSSDARKLVPISFLIIVGTVAIYGLTAAPLARRLGLADINPQGILIAGASAWIRSLAAELKKHGIAVALVDTNYRNISAAKMEGLRAHCMSILSEHIEEESDLSGIGRMLAMTSNDEVNVLATHEYEHLFGRKNVFQLQPRKSSFGSRPSLGERLDGRILFGNDWTEDRLAAAFDQGFQIKSTQLTEEFTYDDYMETYNDEAIVLMALNKDKKLEIMASDSEFEPKAGMTLISLAPVQPSQSV